MLHGICKGSGREGRGRLPILHCPAPVDGVSDGILFCVLSISLYGTVVAGLAMGGSTVERDDCTLYDLFHEI